MPLRSYIPSRTLTLFNLYYIFSVLQCNLISVLFIISNFNSFYQDLYPILWKIPKILRTSAFPQPLPHVRKRPLLKHPLPLFADVLYGRPLIPESLFLMASLNLVLISPLASFTAGVSHGGGLTLHETCQVSSRVS